MHPSHVLWNDERRRTAWIAESAHDRLVRLAVQPRRDSDARQCAGWLAMLVIVAAIAAPVVAMLRP